jgi:hypothetical protein
MEGGGSSTVKEGVQHGEGQPNMGAKAERAAKRWAARAAAKAAIAEARAEESRADAAMAAAARAQRHANLTRHQPSEAISVEMLQGGRLPAEEDEQSTGPEDESDVDAADEAGCTESRQERGVSVPRLQLSSSAEMLRTWASKELAFRHATAWESRNPHARPRYKQHVSR